MAGAAGVAIDTGAYTYTAASTTAGITIATPQLDINTVAAGGGSCLSFKGGLLRAGPESAGAVPGPACYRCLRNTLVVI